MKNLRLPLLAVVAIPEHRGDNWHETDDAGPESWKRRPKEISRAIDAVSRAARFGPLVNTDKVGVHGVVVKSFRTRQ